MDQNKYYKTNAFYLTAFLLSKDVVLEDVEKPTINKAIFIFQNSDELHELIRVFNLGADSDPALQVSFKKIETAIKKLKSLIYE